MLQLLQHLTNSVRTFCSIMGVLLTLFGMGGASAQAAATPTIFPPSESVEQQATTEAATPATSIGAATVEDAPIDGDTALLQGLNKVTAETSTIEVPVSNPVAFGGLTIEVKKCVKSRQHDEPENAALMLIKDVRSGEKPITVFSGWMFASSPALSALEHPTYDVTVLECVVRKKPKN